MGLRWLLDDGMTVGGLVPVLGPVRVVDVGLRMPSVGGETFHVPAQAAAALRSPGIAGGQLREPYAAGDGLAAPRVAGEDLA